MDYRTSTALSSPVAARMASAFGCAARSWTGDAGLRSIRTIRIFMAMSLVSLPVRRRTPRRSRRTRSDPEQPRHCATRTWPTSTRAWMASESATARNSTRIRLEAAHASSSIGICYRHMGQPRRALNAHRTALKLSEVGSFDHLCFNCHGNIAVVLGELGNFAAAIKASKRRSISRGVCGVDERKAMRSGISGERTGSSGHFEKAADLHKRDLEIAREIGNERGVANALGELGNALVALGKVAEGRVYHLEQLQLAETLSQPREIANALVNLTAREFPRAEAVRGDTRVPPRPSPARRVHCRVRQAHWRPPFRFRFRGQSRGLACGDLRPSRNAPSYPYARPRFPSA